MQVSQFAQNGPPLPNYLDLHRYLAKTRRAKIHPTLYGIVRSILPKTHKTGLLAHVIKLYLRPR